jgi:hypothetical protein
MSLVAFLSCNAGDDASEGQESNPQEIPEGSTLTEEEVSEEVNEMFTTALDVEDAGDDALSSSDNYFKAVMKNLEATVGNCKVTATRKTIDDPAILGETYENGIEYTLQILEGCESPVTKSITVSVTSSSEGEEPTTQTISYEDLTRKLAFDGKLTFLYYFDRTVSNSSSLIETRFDATLTGNFSTELSSNSTQEVLFKTSVEKFAIHKNIDLQVERQALASANRQTHVEASYEIINGVHTNPLGTYTVNFTAQGSADGSTQRSVTEDTLTINTSLAIEISELSGSVTYTPADPTDEPIEYDLDGEGTEDDLTVEASEEIEEQA